MGNVQFIINMYSNLYKCIHNWFVGSQAAQINAKLEFLPTSIEYVKTEKTAESCYGVSWTEDDRILCAMNKQVEVRTGFDLQLNKTVVFDDGRNAHSAVLVCGKLFTKCLFGKQKKYITYSGSLDEPTQTVLHSEEDEKPTKIIHISANKEYVASVDYVNKTLKVFSSIDNEHLFDIQLPGMQHPYGVHLTSDGVLVTDWKGGKLSKFSLLPSDDPLWIWTCKELNKAGGITTDESGFIYVAGTSSLAIYIISPEGN